MRVLDALASGRHMKQVATDHCIPLGTLVKVLARYRHRHGFRSTYQMLAVHLEIKRKVKS